ncbi:RidA family protein [Mahella sp.]|uniref:RidA family protein n=1 Tax=Mahella sp. TaxID=2798721 RepID=UPI0025C421DE|nr:RidA family protein [Mahella sp.]MBZ4665516.1 Endoribonuclease [Mahella sp.]
MPPLFLYIQVMLLSIVEERIKALGLELPQTAAPMGAYIPAIICGNMVFVSGQLPIINGVAQYKGSVGGNISVDEGYQAARLAAINALAALKSAVENLDNVKRIVKITGYVRSAPGFEQQAKIVNGASELMADIFGETGRHARAAIGVSELPAGVPVEIELIAEI